MFSNCVWSRLAGLFLIGCAAFAAHAQSPLDLATVLDQTLRHHPVLARIDAQRRRLDPAVTLAMQSPPLNLGAEAENLDSDGSERLEATLSLFGVLQWAGQPQARGAVAASENEATLLQLAQQRRDVLAQAANRYIGLAGAQQALALARASRDLAQKTQVATQRRQQAGAASQADLQRARLLRDRAELGWAQAELVVQTTRQALLLATGASQLPPGPVAADLARLPELPDSAYLLALASAAPAVQLADARLTIARSRLELARRQSRPDLSWRLGLRHEGEQDDESVVLGFSLPLGQGSRNQPLRERAQAGVDVAGHSREIASLELQGLLLDTWQALANGRREAETLDARLIPQGEAVVASLRAGYERGRYSLLELSSAEAELNTLRGQLLSARVRYHLSWIALERLLGRPLILPTEQEKDS